MIECEKLSDVAETITDFSGNSDVALQHRNRVIVYYISGYIVRQFLKSTNCDFFFSKLPLPKDVVTLYEAVFTEEFGPSTSRSSISGASILTRT